MSQQTNDATGGFPTEFDAPTIGEPGHGGLDIPTEFDAPPIGEPGQDGGVPIIEWGAGLQPDEALVAQGMGVIPPGYEDEAQDALNDRYGGRDIPPILPEQSYPPDPGSLPEPNPNAPPPILPEESYRSFDADAGATVAVIPEELEPRPSGDIPEDQPFPRPERDTDDPFSGEIA